MNLANNFPSRVGTLLCLTTLQLTARCWRDGRAPLAAFSAGMGNTSYCGIPVAVMLFEGE